jgi:hypothetical protein
MMTFKNQKKADSDYQEQQNSTLMDTESNVWKG